MPDEKGRLTPHDLAFGLGRKATKEELEELINRPQGPGVDIETARAEAKEYLQALRENVRHLEISNSSFSTSIN